MKRQTVPGVKVGIINPVSPNGWLTDMIWSFLRLVTSSKNIDTGLSRLSRRQKSLSVCGMSFEPIALCFIWLFSIGYQSDDIDHERSRGIARTISFTGLRKYTESSRRVYSKQVHLRTHSGVKYKTNTNITMENALILLFIGTFCM